MPKRKRVDDIEAALRSVFKEITNIISNGPVDGMLKKINDVESTFFSAIQKQKKRMAAGDFSFEEAISKFQLNYSEDDWDGMYMWNIHILPDFPQWQRCGKFLDHSP
jgi:hypothetical protein